MTTEKKPHRILRSPEVKERSGLSRTQIWRKSTDPLDDFPAAVELGSNSIGWFEDEINVWLESRPRRSGGLQ